jgi:hypothetical protein
MLGLSPMLLCLTPTIRLLFTRLVTLARLVLRLVLLLIGRAALIRLLAAITGFAPASERLRFLVAIVKAIFARLVAALIVRTVQPGIRTELLLRGGNHAEIMLRVLKVILGTHRVARRLRVAGKLDILLGNVRCRPADFYVGPVRFIDPRQRILALAIVIIIIVVPSAHTLIVLTVSHGLPVCQPRIAANVADLLHSTRHAHLRKHVNLLGRRHKAPRPHPRIP